jgi:hypothetical protein
MLLAGDSRLVLAALLPTTSLLSEHRRLFLRAFLSALRRACAHPTTDHSMPWLSFDAALIRGLTVISIS